jgi:hypothetical protein
MSLPIGPLGPPRGAGPWAATARPAAGDHP